MLPTQSAPAIGAPGTALVRSAELLEKSFTSSCLNHLFTFETYIIGPCVLGDYNFWSLYLYNHASVTPSFYFFSVEREVTDVCKTNRSAKFSWNFNVSCCVFFFRRLPCPHRHTRAAACGCTLFTSFLHEFTGENRLRTNVVTGGSGKA